MSPKFILSLSDRRGLCRDPDLAGVALCQFSEVQLCWSSPRSSKCPRLTFLPTFHLATAAPFGKIIASHFPWRVLVAMICTTES